MPEILKAKLTGISPLLMHSGQLVDPMNRFTKALKQATKASNRKTEEGIAEIRKLEWFGGLYQDENGKIGIPADLILAVALGGAKKSKQGGEAKAGVYESQPFFPLEYNGPKDAKKLYENNNFVDYRGARVGQARVMRCRPIFKDWSVTIELLVDTDVMDRDSLITALKKAGSLVGLGDWRPRFGRFDVEVLP
jgi:hypothetical protein